MSLNQKIKEELFCTRLLNSWHRSQSSYIRLSSLLHSCIFYCSRTRRHFSLFIYPKNHLYCGLYQNCIKEDTDYTSPCTTMGTQTTDHNGWALPILCLRDSAKLITQHHSPYTIQYSYTYTYLCVVLVWSYTMGIKKHKSS